MRLPGCLQPFSQELDSVVAVARWVVQPWVVVGAPDTRLQVDGLPGNLLGSQLAGVGHPAGRDAFHGALLPPWIEALRFGYRPRVLDPLDHLGHGDEVHVIMIGEDLVDPVEESVQVFGVVLQPCGVEIQSERSSVLLVMSVEVMVEEVVELIAAEDVRAGVDHSASW